MNVNNNDYTKANLSNLKVSLENNQKIVKGILSYGNKKFAVSVAYGNDADEEAITNQVKELTAKMAAIADVYQLDTKTSKLVVSDILNTETKVVRTYLQPADEEKAKKRAKKNNETIASRLTRLETDLSINKDKKVYKNDEHKKKQREKISKLRYILNANVNLPSNSATQQNNQENKRLDNQKTNLSSSIKTPSGQNTAPSDQNTNNQKTESVNQQSSTANTSNLSTKSADKISQNWSKGNTHCQVEFIKGNIDREIVDTVDIAVNAANSEMKYAMGGTNAAYSKIFSQDSWDQEAIKYGILNVADVKAFKFKNYIDGKDCKKEKILFQALGPNLNINNNNSSHQSQDKSLQDIKKVYKSIFKKCREEYPHSTSILLPLISAGLFSNGAYEWKNEVEKAVIEAIKEELKNPDCKLNTIKIINHTSIPCQELLDKNSLTK